MQLMTFDEIKTKIQSDYDLLDEVFIDEDALLGYINEAIDDAETTIHTLHYEDKYFLVQDTFSWVNGTQDYTLPTDIYSNKIRLIFYSNGEDKYVIKRITNLAQIPYILDSDMYQYIIYNTTAAGVFTRFFPTPVETSTNAMIWYIRNMKRMTTSASASNVCEIPECVNFVYQHVRRSCAKKTRRADMIQMENDALKEQYVAMCDALKDMTAEENNLVPMDLQTYFDQEIDYRY
jgi:hypothetical protein